MKLDTSSGILFVAFILSLIGLIASMVMPQNNASDALMIVALFIAAVSGIIASVFTKKLAKSKQWNYMIIGGLLLLVGFFVKLSGFAFWGNILKASGGAISIIALGFYIYLYRSDFRNSNWVWFIPFLLLGCLFRLISRQSFK